ncbi:MAG: helix-hairpin-helix domain-containing protein [Pseudomonadota bacterium]
MSTTAIILLILSLVLLAFAIWLILQLGTSTVVVRDQSARQTGDVLDEGAARAKRNQALIDAPPATVTQSAPAQQPVPVAKPETADEPAPAMAPSPAAAPKPTPSPVPAPVSERKPEPAPSTADDLTRIKGVGPKLVALLHEQGVTSFAQIAAWDDAEIARVDSMLGRFQGRIARDQWVEQAKYLANNDKSGFEEKFGQTK